MVSQSDDVGGRFLPATFVFCYTVAVLSCLTVRPLWLDEVLQLMGTRLPSVEAMLRWVPINIGGVPLGYLTQRPFVLAGGPVAFWARFPSALFSVVSCWLVIVLCRELRIPRSATLFAAGIFMILPAQFRYATEARPYSEALCFMLLSLVALVKWQNQARVGSILLFLVATVAGLYTQPYSVLAVAGVCIWNALPDLRGPQRRHATVPLMALVAAGLLFLPWYLLTTRQWDRDIQLSGYPKFQWTFALALDAFKGLSGGSFLCSVALLALVVVGILSSAAATRGLLLSGALFVLVGALSVDWLRNYFFAARQFSFAAPCLSILAAIGLRSQPGRTRAAGMVMAAVFIIAALTNDVSMQLNAREDWPAAAKLLAHISQEGYCIQMAGTDQGGVLLYSVFVPGLLPDLCRNLSTRSRVALVSNLATSAETLNASQEQLRNLGFSLKATTAAGGTTVRMVVR